MIYNPSIWRTAKRLLDERGRVFVIHTGIKMIVLLPQYVFYKIFRSSATFKLQGETYRYLYAYIYNMTWRTERAVEIPIIWNIIKRQSGGKILEIGNVLSHYFAIYHEVLDKYDKADGVINQDVVDFKPSKKYDLIVSISTLEHVGWDETPREPMKVMTAIENLRSLLNPDGRLVVTLPVGYNPEMDKLIQDGGIKFDQLSCLKRTSLGTWVEADWESIREQEYDRPFPDANGLLIGTLSSL